MSTLRAPDRAPDSEPDPCGSGMCRVCAPPWYAATDEQRQQDARQGAAALRALQTKLGPLAVLLLQPLADVAQPQAGARREHEALGRARTVVAHREREAVALPI